MAEEKYIYAVTRIHINEQNLLTRRNLDAMISFESVSDCLSLLAGKGWDAKLAAGGDFEALINMEQEKTWALIAEAAGDVAELDVFRKTRDFHNLKAAIKLIFTAEPEAERKRYYLPYGAVPVSKIEKAAESLDFSMLPEDMAKAGKEAWEVLKDTGNGQLCEIAIDRASLEALAKAGEEAKSEIISKYCRLSVDSANVKAAARAAKLGKDRGFLERLIASGGNVDKGSLESAALAGVSEIVALLRRCGMAKGAQALEESTALFERWAGDEAIRLMQPMRTRISGIEPLAAFILARENEMRQVRLIASAKVNRLSEGVLKERLGLTYV
ncbi:MAG: V-type ATPase subunit [Clostridiales bacterium]|jgi:V/A-type H+-transporting ATPase subunit C|nr:V-type ATPase subunit [Clostridiales bacterium]